MEQLFNYALTAAYIMGAIASPFGILRAIVDYKRTGQRVRLMGVLTHGAIFCICALISIGAGENPWLPPDVTRSGIRLSFMAWAVFEMLFAFFYAITFVRVRNEFSPYRKLGDAVNFLQLLKDAWVNSGEPTKVAIVITVALLVGLVIWMGYGNYLLPLFGR